MENFGDYFLFFPLTYMLFFPSFCTSGNTLVGFFFSFPLHTRDNFVVFNKKKGKKKK